MSLSLSLSLSLVDKYTILSNSPHCKSLKIYKNPSSNKKYIIAMHKIVSFSMHKNSKVLTMNAKVYNLKKNCIYHNQNT